MPDVAEIAGRLSEAQREVLQAIGKDWAWYNRRGSTTGWSLVGKGLAERRFEKRANRQPGPQYRLTPLGLAVRAYLENSREQ